MDEEAMMWVSVVRKGYDGCEEGISLRGKCVY